MKRQETPTMFAQLFFGISLMTLTVTACSSLSGNSPIRAKELAPDNLPPIVGQAAKVVKTPTSSIYAFSYHENGRHMTCQAPVTLDAQQQPIPQKRWVMRCSHPSAQATPQQVITRELSFSSDALFDLDKSKLNEMKPQGRQRVEQLAKSLRNEYSEQPKLIVTGYTDRIGSPQAQEKLALNLAKAVAEILRQSGIRQELITVQSKGSTESVVNCPGINTTTPELIRCLQPNRRIKVQVIGN
ncbi:OmpA family protein [Pseudomonas sp. 09C 129]|uniref:OmpA family protein n=1 Tax=Pseudomonas sp. 09C 129 TaxID=2054915 RepID=UPI0012FF2F45|nr:OmpA family protein [Pseudomonas sp. 09C 129]